MLSILPIHSCVTAWTFCNDSAAVFTTVRTNVVGFPVSMWPIVGLPGFDLQQHVPPNTFCYVACACKYKTLRKCFTFSAIMISNLLQFTIPNFHICHHFSSFIGCLSHASSSPGKQLFPRRKQFPHLKPFKNCSSSSSSICRIQSPRLIILESRL